MGFNISFALFFFYLPLCQLLKERFTEIVDFQPCVIFLLKYTSHWEAKVPLAISWQSAIALYEKKEHAFADNFVMLHTKQGPLTPLRTPLPRSATWQRNIFLVLIRECVELMIKPGHLIYRLFIT